MDWEKKYKEALARAKEFHKSKEGLCVLTAESIFPELCESEDERIRKEIIDFIQWAEDRGMTRHDYHQAKRPAVWITYLENQKPSFRQIHDGVIWDNGLRVGMELEKHRKSRSQ